MTCMVCERFLDRFAGEARDIRTRHAGDARTVVKLIFRTYQQHQQDEWTVRSLDLIDRLCLEGDWRGGRRTRAVRAVAGDGRSARGTLKPSLRRWTRVLREHNDSVGRYGLTGVGWWAGNT